jgi:hypothetical protein
MLYNEDGFSDANIKKIELESQFMPVIQGKG